MKPIMLATDGSPTAGEATKTAIELAKRFDTELLIVTAWDIPYSTLGYAAVPPVGDLMKVGKEQADKVAGEAAAAAKAEGVAVRAFVVRGFPVEEIGAMASKFPPEIIVLGSHGWGPMKRMLFGSVSTGVLHHASCPVLVVPAASPDGADSQREVRAEVTVSP
jgi:nucleotide-binding universal stress UspA family protein